MAGYHTLARSLELAAGAAPPAWRVFSDAVGHMLNGFIDNERFHHAGRLTTAKRVSESALTGILADELRIDMNPFVQCMLLAPNRQGALLVHQSLNKFAALAVRTEMGFDGAGSLTVVSRTASSTGDDPAACRDAHLMGMDLILGSIGETGASVAGSSRVSPPRLLSALAHMLGLGSSAASDAALAFESDAELRVDDVARLLGCHRRTLQREFQASGITAETLKRACMLSRATALLPSALTLTEIAHEAGYSDHAHMTRAFVASCALAPSILRQAFSLPPIVH